MKKHNGLVTPQPPKPEAVVTFDPMTGDVSLRSNTHPKLTLFMLAHASAAVAAKLPEPKQSNIVLAQPQIPKDLT